MRLIDRVLDEKALYLLLALGYIGVLGAAIGWAGAFGATLTVAIGLTLRVETLSAEAREARRDASVYQSLLYETIELLKASADPQTRASGNKLGHDLATHRIDKLAGL